jgi:LacI family gluconate utilization system Gnt-I transcriptional repressor
LEKGIDVPGKIGLAGFNGVDLLEGLPRRLASMDACRREIGERAAQIIAERTSDKSVPPGTVVELSPKIAFGDTLKRV